jgi:hypothetical protein
MREHAGTQAAAPVRGQTETNPVDRDEQHQFPALISGAVATDSVSHRWIDLEKSLAMAPDQRRPK